MAEEAPPPPISSIPEGIDSLKRVVSEVQESLVNTQHVDIVSRSSDLAQMAEKLAFESYRFMTGADQLNDNNAALRRHTQAVETLLEELPTNRALQKEVGVHENVASQLREQLAEATQTNSTNLVVSEERIETLVAESATLRGENDILRQHSIEDRTANGELTRQNEAALGLLHRLVQARNQADVERLQAEARELLGYQERLTTPVTTSTSGVVDPPDLSTPEQQKGNVITTFYKKSRDTAFRTMNSMPSISNMKRKHSRSSPPKPPAPDAMLQILSGPAAALPNDPAKPEARNRSYIIIDCSSRARLENSVLFKTTLDRIQGTRPKPWDVVLKRIEVCRGRVRDDPRYKVPLCLAHSCQEAACGWTFEALEQNQICSNCADSDSKVWERMRAGESPQCLKAPEMFPNELWLLNPLPGDLAKQHACDVENSQRQEEPVLSHTRKGSGEGPLSKLTKLTSSSHASLPGRQLRSQASKSTVRGGQQYQLPSRNFGIPSEPSHSSSSREPAWGTGNDDSMDYNAFIDNAAAAAVDRLPPSERSRPPASEISVSSSLPTARASTTDRVNPGLDNPPPNPSLSQQSLDQPPSLQHDFAHSPRPTTRGRFQPARPPFSGGTWGR
ncbi:hypothetical protein KCU93_g9442, partial [Aureobasidium melanogenum]